MRTGPSVLVCRMKRPSNFRTEPSSTVSTIASPSSFATGVGYACRRRISSTAGPRRTTRPRRSSAATSKGRIVSSTEVSAGSRSGTRGRGWFMLDYMACRGQITNPLSPSRDEAPGENTFLGVQTVFRLVKHHRSWAIDHLVGDLLAPMRRQAMHEQRVRLRLRQQPRVDLVTLE